MIGCWSLSSHSCALPRVTPPSPPPPAQVFFHSTQCIVLPAIHSPRALLNFLAYVASLSSPSPSHNSPRLPSAHHYVHSAVAELARPGPQKFSKRPRGNSPQSRVRPHFGQLLQRNAILGVPRVLERGLFEKLDDDVLIREKLGGGGHDGSGLVVDSLGVVPGRTLDAPE